MTDEFTNKFEHLKGPSKEAQEDLLLENDTKQTVIRPFIAALGYNIHNRKEVVEEHYPDKELNRDRVDFSINIDGKQIIILEAKAARENLHSPRFLEQLYDYFTPSKAKIAILTNGIEAWFYSDLNETNIMDKKPFFKFNFQKNNDFDISFLKLFCKNEFSLEKIIEHAEKMKAVDEVKNFIETDVINPSKKFTDFVIKNVLGNNLKKNSNNKKIVESAVAASMQAIKVKTLMQANKSTVESVDNLPISTATDSLSVSTIASKPEIKDSRKQWHQEPSYEVEKLYQKYSNGIKKIAGMESESSKKFYFTYKKNGRDLFCSLRRCSKSIRIDLKLNSIEVLGGYTGGCIDYEGKGHLGVGTHYVDVNLDDNDNDNRIYDYIMEQIRRTYEHTY